MVVGRRVRFSHHTPLYVMRGQRQVMHAHWRAAEYAHSHPAVAPAALDFSLSPMERRVPSVRLDAPVRPTQSAAFVALSVRMTHALQRIWVTVVYAAMIQNGPLKLWGRCARTMRQGNICVTAKVQPTHAQFHVVPVPICPFLAKLVLPGTLQARRA